MLKDFLGLVKLSLGEESLSFPIRDLSERGVCGGLVHGVIKPLEGLFRLVPRQRHLSHAAVGILE